MKNLKSLFRFNKQERSGIFFLLLIIISLQVGYYFYRHFSLDAKKDAFVIDYEYQIQIDALKKAALKKDSVKIYPFNPNFITDYKGYVLGMSTDEIDRLHAFRKQNKFANTAEEFQKVTQVSDSLLKVISPNFKFPEWTKKSPGLPWGNKNGKQQTTSNTQYSENNRSFSKGDVQVEQSSAEAYQISRPAKGYGPEKDILTESDLSGPIEDLNTASAEELRAVNGIGEKLSARIVKFRKRLGGFLSDDQLYDVYGLDPEVVERALKRFKVLQTPEIQKININTASAWDISSLAYIQKQVADRIVEYRNDNGSILSLEELKNIEGFPSDKIDRIALYLSL